MPRRSLLLFVCALLACAAPALAQDPPEFSIDVTSAIVSFPFRIVDAEFSSSLNAIVAVSESPNQLHIYRPDTGELVSVNLEVPPYCVSVSPDGHRAAVGHDAWISHVDLDDAELLQTVSVSAVITDIVLADTGWAYAFPSGSFISIRSVNLNNGTQSQGSGSTFGSPIARMHPSGLAMYGATRSVSPGDIEKYPIANDGVASVGNDSPYHGNYDMCGDLWLSVDGQRIYTACGNVFRSSTDPLQDMQYVGSFSQPVFARWAAHTQTGGTIAVAAAPASSTANGEIRYFTPDFLLYRGKAVLPRFVAGQDTWAAHGRWVFFNAAGTKQYVIVQAEPDSELTNDFGVVTVDCTNAAVTLNPTGASFGSAFATAQFAVTGTPGCGWASTSNVPWINTNSYGVGDGTVTYTVSANTGVAPRNGTITVGGATFTVSQAGAVPVSLAATATSPTSVSLTWSSAIAAEHFEVWRSAGAGFTLVGTPATAAFTDTTAADSGYVYKVRAVVAGGAMSEFSVPDYAHTFTLTDPALGAGMLIRAAHVTELRSAVNAVRAAAGLAPAAFEDPSLVSVPPKRVHVTELRIAIAAARSALGMPAFSFSTLPVNDVIRASTTEELRTAAR